MAWPFDDPPNVAVFTTHQILEREDRIGFVTHDLDDGAWQFHARSGAGAETDAKIVSLRAIVDLDPSVMELADLPLGWCAWRKEGEDTWHRREMASSR